jgi:hypothetical protein
MYTGKVIEELIALVVRAEQRAYYEDTTPLELPAWMTENVQNAELAGVA